MKKSITFFFVVVLASSVISTAIAGIPVWTFSAPNPARTAVAPGTTATVEYTVTNQSTKGKRLILKPVRGLSAPKCALPMKGSTCLLTLTVNGSEIPALGIHQGPILCDETNTSQCYQPDTPGQLNISRAVTLGSLQLTQFGLPFSLLEITTGNSGTLTLTNTGEATVTAISIQFPAGTASYFTNNCPTSLVSRQSCTITYNVPNTAANGVFNSLLISGASAANTVSVPIDIFTAGTAKCWGNNEYGQLGSIINSGNDNPNNSPLDVQTLSSGVLMMTSGEEHTCALLNTGGVKCWGINELGQMGTTINSGNRNINNSPLDVQNLSSGVVAISAGGYFTCALLDTGGIKCWGYNLAGQLGAPVVAPFYSDIPLDVQTLNTGVVAITTGGEHACALMDTGGAKCWGFNSSGQLGSVINSGTGLPNDTPLDVQTLNTGVAAISAGRNFTCAVLDTGAAKCWGVNQRGQLGALANVLTINPNNSPLDVQTLNAGAVAISAGSQHACAIMNTGAIKCWGLNRYGQLGNAANVGTLNANTVPLDVGLAPGSIATSLVSGSRHTCTLLDTGAPQCWGSNEHGQLGSLVNSGNNNPNIVPLDVQTLGAGSTIALVNRISYYLTCAIVN